MIVPEFDILYNDLTEEKLMFLSLKYQQCQYNFSFDTAGAGLIKYDDPDEWPALFVMERCGQKLAGVFTSAMKVNLAFVQTQKIDDSTQGD